MPEEQPPTPDANEVEPDTPAPASELEAFDEFDEIVDAAINLPREARPESPIREDVYPASRPASTARSQTLQTLQQLWQRTQPRLRAGTVRLLKSVIQLLEGAVTQLETGTDAIDPNAQLAAEPLPLPDWADDLRETAQQGWQGFWRWWNRVLPKIRGFLPASVNQALSDRALTGAIAGILVLVVWTGSSLLSSKPPKQVAVVPPSKTTPAKPSPVKPAPTKERKEPKPKNVPEVKVIPPPKPAVKESPQPSPGTEPVQPKPSPTAEAAKPSPRPSVPPTPIASPSPSPSPTPAPPPLKLTPEQDLIARIQDQVAEVSNQYVSGLIQSVQANFRSSRLLVKVGTGWYSLTPTQQDSLANDILKRAQQLNFIKLELVDPNGNLLARSPVIGSEMVVLQRSQSLSDIPPQTS